MGVVPPPHSSPRAPEDRPWKWHGSAETRKGNAIIERGGWKAFARAHAWYEAAMDEEGNDPPREKEAYKLPHHELIDGELKVVWHGVRAAMQVLAGARGGVDIPEADRGDVYRHLTRHYRQFGRKPPPVEKVVTS